jgi:hypothetical protein
MAMGDPYCSHCNYNLKGLTDSSKCVECGKPLVEVLARRLPDFNRGQHSKRYKSKVILFGLPLVHVALGPDENSRRGVAKGIIAIGDVAFGFVAIGGVAVGGLTFGGLAVGLYALAGCAIGLVAVGGWAVGGLAAGGGAIGVIAMGGGAAGFVGVGGGAFGYYAKGGGGMAKYALFNMRQDPEALQFFNNDMSWFFANGWTGPVAWMVFIWLAMLSLMGCLVLIAYLRRDRQDELMNPSL